MKKIKNDSKDNMSESINENILIIVAISLIIGAAAGMILATYL